MAQSTEEIVEQARKLGRMLAENDRVQAFRQARQEVERDADAKKLLADYEDRSRKIHQLTVENKPIEAEDKRALADLESRLVASDLLQTLVRTQADYVEVMRKVHTAIDAHGQADAPG